MARVEDIRVIADLQLALAYTAALTRRVLPGFAGRLAVDGRGLAVDVPGKGSGWVAPPWSLPADSPGLGQHTSPAVAAMAALGVYVAAVLEHQADGQDLRLVASASAMLRPGGVPGPREWLGFLPVRDGWVGVAAVGERNSELLAATRSRGALAWRQPPAAASYLQGLGLAALPARPARARSRASPVVGTAAPLVAAEGGRQPLSRLRVLDLGRVVAGPFAAQALAALGAQLLAVRPPGQGQRWGGGEEVDLRSHAGARRLRTLVAEADLVVENYRPRGWEQLIDARTAGLIRHRVALRGFPGTSTCRNWKLFGFLVEAAFGAGWGPLASRRPHPVPAPQVPLWDRLTGLVGAATALRLVRGDEAVREVAQVPLALDLVRTRRLNAHAA